MTTASTSSPVKLLVAVGLWLGHTKATPSASQLFVGGGLTILTHNDLDAAHNDGSGAILVSQTGPYSAATTACTLLGEVAWNPDKQDFNKALNRSLEYQEFQGFASEDQLYWVSKAKEDDDACRGIDTSGRVHDLDCLSEIPTLCTQSAPVSNSSFSNSSAAWQVTQVVDQSQFTGYRDYHTWKFRGVRYSKTPARFTYATPYLEPGDVSAITAGADCVQPIGEVKSGSSEDCLFMNIWTPYLPPSSGAKGDHLKPVMVYLYGGGLTSGSGKNPNTDGTNLASRGDVVVISVNYRVGSIGFLAFEDGVHNGNYGVSDMVTALEWVQKYVKYFGGDASKVTVFGESAGAQSTHLLLQSPKAKGLFHRAIMQSDPTGYPNNGTFKWSQYATIKDAYESGTKKVLNETGCLASNSTSPIDCLSKVSGFDLVNLTTNFNGVVVDGTYLTYHELVVNDTNPYSSNVDVMTGTNRDEVGVQIEDYPDNGTTFTKYFQDHVRGKFGLSEDFASKLSLDSFGTAQNSTTPEQIFNASLRIGTDGVFTCYDLAKAYSAAKHKAFKSMYAFEFNRTYSPSGYTQTWCDAPKTAQRPHGDPDAEYYKCHAGEQLIVFGNELRAGQPARDDFDVPFMQLVIDYWAAFARTGDPNPSSDYLVARGHQNTLDQIRSTGKWLPVDAEKPSVRLLQWNGAQVPFPEMEQCKAIGIPLDVLESS